MDVSIFNFSGIYENEDFYLKSGSPSFIDLKEITGTNCLCDDIAIKEIKSIIKKKKISHKGMHFIDSGNYHYMSRIFTDYINEDFCLVVFDHHPDMQETSFGGILSCGSWVMNTMDNNPHLKEVIVVGADWNLITKVPDEYRERVHFLDKDDIGMGVPYIGELPVYLSIDKDVILREELLTNWDQGTMETEMLMAIVSQLVRTHRIIGIDVCGECAPDQEGVDNFTGLMANNMLNKRLYSLAGNI